MSEHDYYVTYRLATEQIRERTQLAERTRTAGPRSHKGGRHGIARRLHWLADRLDG